jgi:hypothetical protein
MKSKRFLLPIALLFVAILTVFVVFGNQDVVAATFAQMGPPTPAPTRTPGPPVGITPRPIPTLVQPLTEEQALTKVLEIDSRTAIWRSTLWSLNTVHLEPGRISIKWYSDRAYDGSWYAPDAETGPVWVVTIKGDVRLSLIGMGFDSRRIYDGVTYIIAQKTGDLLGVDTGLPSSSQPFIPKTAIPAYQIPSAGTPAALTSAACTQNPSGLSLRISQQPGKSSIPGAGGPVYSFLVEGTGFVPGEKVSIVIKGRVTAPGSLGTTSETVGQDSTFATSIGAAVSQPNMPFDFFVVHRRGVACVSVVTVQ